MPQDDLFADEPRRRPRPPSCSATRPTRSQPGAVRGIAQLTASSREGPQDRQRDDHRRRPAGSCGRRATAPAAGGGRPTKQAAEARFARRAWRRTINAMLAATLGPGKAQVKVNADLNMDKTTKDR